MPDPKSTRWSLIRRAAEGGESEREEFARGYEPIIRAYLASRWRRLLHLGEIDDATQEVFLACFRAKGALGRAESGRSGGFRAYLYGIVKNVARRFEEKSAKLARQPDSRVDLEKVEADEETLSRVFDRAWAKAILTDAVQLHSERAEEGDHGAVRRVELLRLRFHEGLPIREIARLWNSDPTHVHREYARGRREFASALRDVVKIHLPGSASEINAECARLAEFFR